MGDGATAAAARGDEASWIGGAGVDGAAPPDAGAPLAGAEGASGAPNAALATAWPNAGVGGRSVAAGKEGAPNAVLAGGVRRGGAKGGTRAGGGETGVGVRDVVTDGTSFETLTEAAAGVAARGLGAAAARTGVGAEASASGKSSPQLTLAETGMTPPHTEQRALTAAPTTLAGSTRKTDRHSGHETFIHSSTMLMALGARGGVGSPPAAMKSVRRSTEYTDPTSVLA